MFVPKKKRRKENRDVNLSKIQVIAVLIILTIMTFLSIQRLLFRISKNKAKRISQLKRQQQKRNRTSSMLVEAATTTRTATYRQSSFVTSMHHRVGIFSKDETPSNFHNRRSGLFLSSTTKSEKKKEEEDDLEDIKFDFEQLDLNGWKELKYNDDSTGEVVEEMMTATSSPVETCMVRNRQVFIKRDDSYHLKDSYVNGNKARKMLPLNQISSQQFPNVIVSYGGPQSNAMLALAAIVHSKNTHNNLHDKQPPHFTLEQFDALSDNDDEYDAFLKQYDDDDDDESLSPTIDDDAQINKKRFIYYAKKLPRYLRKQPNGNLLRALSLGMELKELSPTQYNQYFGGLYGGNPKPPPNLSPPQIGSSTWIPQGGACTIAIPGATVLAHEIVQFWSSKNGRHTTPLSVCLPGGTCTTATFLSLEIQKILQQPSNNYQHLDIQVVVIPCIGDAAYAKRQMKNLCRQAANDDNHHYPSLQWMEQNLPIILQPKVTKKSNGSHQSNNKRKSNGYFVFGEPSKPIWDTYCEMKEQYGIHVDLLYGAPAWNLLLQHWSSSPYLTDSDSNTLIQNSPIAGRQVMYVHSGGLEGVSSQMTRYVHKGLIDAKQLQK